MIIASDLWVSALLRRIEQAGGHGYVTKKGDLRAGSVILKIINQRTRGVILLREALSGNPDAAETVWIRPIRSIDEAELDLYIERQKARDPDLWVIEIEDVEGRHFLTEKVDLG